MQLGELAVPEFETHHDSEVGLDGERLVLGPVEDRHFGGGAAKALCTALVLVADYNQVPGQLADAQLIDGTPLAPSELLKVALEADILPALFDTKGQPLWLGRKCRTATVA